jgi:hypothetical protein
MFSLRTAGAFLVFALTLGSMTGLACMARTAAAEAVGYVAENAFFTGDLGDGINLGRNLTDKGGSRKGSEKGLYGGSRQLDVCDPELLLDFLLKAGNGKKKAAWAKALGISAKDKRVKDFVESLTEVVLANDTLVVNHGYKKGKANRYDALLEAGTAVLVDVFGLPRVKCNCGNPLAVSDHDPGDVDIKFKNKGKGNKKWKVDKDRIVRVEKADEKQKTLVVVDVKDPDDEVPIDLPDPGPTETTEQVPVPGVRDSSEADATQVLTEAGFAVETESTDDPDVEPGFAAGTEPGGGTTAAKGSTVTLLIANAPTTEPVNVPSVVGMPQADAEQTIRDAGLIPVVSTQGVPAEQVGRVISQDPADGQAEPGSTVSLVVGEEQAVGEQIGGTDAGVDGGTDAGTDGGIDTGTDGEADAGAGTGAGADAGTGAGAAAP